jgi:hypothetical protein
LKCVASSVVQGNVVLSHCVVNLVEKPNALFSGDWIKKFLNIVLLSICKPTLNRN